jgi:hypothetical protein
MGNILRRKKHYDYPVRVKKRNMMNRFHSATKKVKNAVQNKFTRKQKYSTMAQEKINEILEKHKMQFITEEFQNFCQNYNIPENERLRTIILEKFEIVADQFSLKSVDIDKVLQKTRSDGTFKTVNILLKQLYQKKMREIKEEIKTQEKHQQFEPQANQPQVIQPSFDKNYTMFFNNSDYDLIFYFQDDTIEELRVSDDFMFYNIDGEMKPLVSKGIVDVHLPGGGIVAIIDTTEKEPEKRLQKMPEFPANYSKKMFVEPSLQKNYGNRPFYLSTNLKFYKQQVNKEPFRVTSYMGWPVVSRETAIFNNYYFTSAVFGFLDVIQHKVIPASYSKKYYILKNGVKKQISDDFMFICVGTNPSLKYKNYETCISDYLYSKDEQWIDVYEGNKKIGQIDLQTEKNNRSLTKIIASPPKTKKINGSKNPLIYMKEEEGKIPTTSLTPPKNILLTQEKIEEIVNKHKNYLLTDDAQKYIYEFISKDDKSLYQVIIKYLFEHGIAPYLKVESFEIKAIHNLLKQFTMSDENSKMLEPIIDNEYRNLKYEKRAIYRTLYNDLLEIYTARWEEMMREVISENEKEKAKKVEEKETKRYEHDAFGNILRESSITASDSFIPTTSLEAPHDIYLSQEQITSIIEKHKKLLTQQDMNKYNDEFNSKDELFRYKSLILYKTLEIQKLFDFEFKPKLISEKLKNFMVPEEMKEIFTKYIEDEKKQKTRKKRGLYKTMNADLLKIYTQRWEEMMREIIVKNDEEHKNKYNFDAYGNPLSIQSDDKEEEEKNPTKKYRYEHDLFGNILRESTITDSNNEEFELVKPIEAKDARKIINVMKTFAKRNSNIRYTGYKFIMQLYYKYLANKYKTTCGKKDFLEIYLNITKNIDDPLYSKELSEQAKELAECIIKKRKFLICDIFLNLGLEGNHTNLLLYRGSNNTLEHFEPHGSQIVLDEHENVNKIEMHLKRFLELVNGELYYRNIPRFTFIPSHEVCPRRKGLQLLEAFEKEIKLNSEGSGYCYAWSMLFTEMCLKNPQFSGKEIMEKLFEALDKMPEEKRSMYLKKVIRGYVNHIYSKLGEVYEKKFGNVFTEENMLNLFHNGLDTKKVLEEKLSNNFIESAEEKFSKEGLSSVSESYQGAFKFLKEKEEALIEKYKKIIHYEANKTKYGRNKNDAKYYEMLMDYFDSHHLTFPEGWPKNVINFYEQLYKQFLDEHSKLKLVKAKKSGNKTKKLRSEDLRSLRGDAFRGWKDV